MTQPEARQPNVILAAFRARFSRNPDANTFTPFGFFEAGYRSRDEEVERLRGELANFDPDWRTKIAREVAGLRQENERLRGELQLGEAPMPEPYLSTADLLAIERLPRCRHCGYLRAAHSTCDICPVVYSQTDLDKGIDPSGALTTWWKP